MLEKTARKLPGRYVMLQALLQVCKMRGTRVEVDRSRVTLLCAKVHTAEPDLKDRSRRYCSHAFLSARPKLPE